MRVRVASHTGSLSIRPNQNFEKISIGDIPIVSHFVSPLVINWGCYKIDIKIVALKKDPIQVMLRVRLLIVA